MGRGSASRLTGVGNRLTDPFPFPKTTPLQNTSSLTLSVDSFLLPNPSPLTPSPFSRSGAKNLHLSAPPPPPRHPTASTSSTRRPAASTLSPRRLTLIAPPPAAARQQRAASTLVAPPPPPVAEGIDLKWRKEREIGVGVASEEDANDFFFWLN
ncbi:unnamed protein product [Linum trigynum]|uniref:Uncharacterized protein n=1 Tax=Linum trigynum TaxID=586398 RepID=A0AAV2E3F4_9ROSI